MVCTRRPTEEYCPDAAHFIPNGVPDRTGEGRMAPGEHGEVIRLGGGGSGAVLRGGTSAGEPIARCLCLGVGRAGMIRVRTSAGRLASSFGSNLCRPPP